jgi:ketosteroid isomerase-like protein
VVYKVNPKIHTCRYDEYMERNEEDVYQEEIEEGENFKIFDGARFTELSTCGIEVMEEESGPSKKHLRKSQGPRKKSLRKSQRMIERCERLNTRVVEADSNADDF